MPLRIGSMVLAAALAAGCHVLPVEPEGGAVPVERLLSGAAVFGTPVPSAAAADAALVEPSPAMRDFVAGHVRRGRTSAARLARLLGKLVQEGYFKDGYRPDLTRTAAAAFSARSGNCLSYTSMFISLARLAGLDARFQEVGVPSRFDADLGVLLRNMHVSALVVNGAARSATLGDVTVDFNAIDTQDYPKRAVSDAYALALYYNNLSVERWRNDAPRLAFAYLRKAIETDAANPNLWVNLGVFYSKHGIYDHAVSAHGRALRLDRRNPSAMAGLAVAYEGLGEVELSLRYARRVQQSRERNPYYHFALAQSAFAASRYAQSVDAIDRALALKADDHRFHALKSRAHKELGEPEQARISLAQAQRYESRDVRQRALRVGRRAL